MNRENHEKFQPKNAILVVIRKEFSPKEKDPEVMNLEGNITQSEELRRKQTDLEVEKEVNDELEETQASNQASRNRAGKVIDTTEEVQSSTCSEFMDATQIHEDGNNEKNEEVAIPDGEKTPDVVLKHMNFLREFWEKFAELEENVEDFVPEENQDFRTTRNVQVRNNSTPAINVSTTSVIRT